MDKSESPINACWSNDNLVPGKLQKSKYGNSSESEEEDIFIYGENTTLINPNDAKLNTYNTPSDGEKQQKLPFPKAVLLIIGNEFCERFSFYGMKTVLALYLANELLMSEDTATAAYHGWASLCYITPLLGAAIADSWLGKYKTILYVSIIYAAGSLVLSLAATTPIFPILASKTAFSSFGLLLIAFGTGGIKPCVSAFGGDQFKLPEQDKEIPKFFSFFYFSINAGSLLSTLITPILREEITCFGGDCYSLAFGVPCVLMFVSIVLFVCGTPSYRIYPPKGNIIGDVISCVAYAGRRKVSSNEKSKHWLDLAKNKYNPTLIRDVKILLQLFVLYLPLPIFWALFDQQGSRWTFQAAKMDGRIGNYTIKPDQIQVLNPLFILSLIPLFEIWIYPTLTKFSLLTKPLQRMVCGGVLAAVAFGVSGLIQMQIENQSTARALEENSMLIFLNPTSCDVDMLSLLKSDVRVPANDRAIALVNFNEALKAMNVSVRPLYDESSCPKSEMKSVISTNVPLVEGKANILVTHAYLGDMNFVVFQSGLEEKMDMGAVRVLDSTGTMRLSLNVVLQSKSIKKAFASLFYEKGIAVSKRQYMPPGRYEIILPNIYDNKTRTIGSLHLERGDELVIFLEDSENEETRAKFQVFSLSSSSIHILWLIPQYIIISVGEIMFSITGLEFSFTQAPTSMKSVIQAAWLLTVGIGNIIVIIPASLSFFHYQSMEFIFFAVLMLCDMIVFQLLTRRYIREKTTYELQESSNNSEADAERDSSTEKESHM